MTNENEQDILLTPAEAGTILGVDPKTVTRWSRNGKIPASRTMGGHRRYRKSVVLFVRDHGHAPPVEGTE